MAYIVKVREAYQARSSACAHRFVRDLHYERPRVIGYHYSIGAIHEEDTLLKSPAPQVLPGIYYVSLSVGGKSLHARPRPYAWIRAWRRLPTPLRRQQTARARLVSLDRAYQGYGELQSIRE